MDYALLSTLSQARDVLPREMTLSYDIACQYSKNFEKRHASYNNVPELQCDLSHVRLDFVVPSMHLQGHDESCWIPFGFKYLDGSGRTSGEMIEQGWSTLNHAAGSSKCMTSGSRSDTLDDHLGMHNWEKIINMGVQFDVWLRKACRSSSVAFREWKQVNDAWPKNVTRQWEAKYATFDRNDPATYTIFQHNSSGALRLE